MSVDTMPLPGDPRAAPPGGSLFQFPVRLGTVVIIAAIAHPVSRRRKTPEARMPRTR
jgi:hypothetical protein